MTRFTVAAAALLSLVAGCGGNGGGGGTKAPFLSSVSPEIGSPRTIWTLTGEGFSKDAEKNTVLFDGIEATVIGVGTGDDPVLMVTATNLDASLSQVVSVTVARGSKRSNPVTVGVVETGSIEELPNPLWTMPDSIALDGTLLLVSSKDGVWEHDLATGEIRPLARAYEGGLRRPMFVAVTPDGSRWIADANSTEDTFRLLRSVDGGAWIPLPAFLSSPAQGLARDPATGNIYVLSGSTIVRIFPDGFTDFAFNPGLPSTGGGIVFQSATLYVTIPSQDKISQVDPTSGTVTDFATGIDGAGPLVGDGSSFYTTDAIGERIVQVSSGGVTSDFFTTATGSIPVDLGTSTLLARRSNGELIVTDKATDIVVSVASGAVEAKDVTSGRLLDASLTFLPDGSLLTTYDVNDCTLKSNGDRTGSLVALRPDGTAHVLTNDVCLAVGATVVGNTLYATDYQGILTTVKTVDLTTGEVTAVASSAEGFVLALTSTADPEGNVYVGSVDIDALEGVVHRIAPDGTKTLSHITLGELFVPITMIAIGDRLLVSTIDLVNGTGAGPMYEAPLSGGPAVEMVLDLGTAFDGFAPDGSGGFYANTLQHLGGLVHVSADGTVTEVGAPEDDRQILAVERDPATGLLWVSLFDGEDSELAILYP